MTCAWKNVIFANFSPENCPSTNSHDGFDNYCENLASKRGIYTKQIQLATVSKENSQSHSVCYMHNNITLL